MKFLINIFLFSTFASAQVTISPNMNLPVPIPGITPGPSWAADINASFIQIDSHNHSFGQGVQIQPNGININADLSFNSNNATALRTARFTAQGTPITSAPPDIGALYVSGNELYYNDVSGGNQVKITTNGSVNSGAGSITGLPSGTASASFSAGTFIWQSATNTAANMDARNYILRNSTANSKGLTLSPPPAMASNISETLPQIPGSTSFMVMDSSGNMSTPTVYPLTSAGIASATITSANLAGATRQMTSQVFTSSGTFTAPAGTSTSTVYKVTCVGGGGGGSLWNNGGTGGGGGGTSIAYVSGLNAGDTRSVGIGSGGAGATTNATSGANGTGSTFGTACIANGGNGGLANGTFISGGEGGAPGTGNITMGGGAGVSNSGGGGNFPVGNGGSSSMGGGGKGASATGSVHADNGNLYGGGGGAGWTSGALGSGGGAAGIVIVEWVQ